MHSRARSYFSDVDLDFLSWWIGWVEWPSGLVFFALNIDTPNRLNDFTKRQNIGRAILQSTAAFPQAEVQSRLERPA